MPHTLDLKLYDLRKVDAERQRFRVYLSFAATVDFEQQIWESGVRLYSGSTKARVRLQAWLDVENTIRIEKGKSFLPDMVIRFRVIDAKLAYRDFVVEHTAGVGGTAARVIGEAIEGLFGMRPTWSGACSTAPARSCGPPTPARSAWASAPCWVPRSPGR